jgi:TonB family protein
MITLLLDATLKTSVILLFALAAATAARRASASVRHWMLSTAIVCALATPVLALFVPSWQAGLSLSSSATRTDPSTAGSGPLQLSSSPAETAVANPASHSPVRETVGRVVVPIWLTGTAISLLLLLVGLGRLALLAARAERVRAPAWTAAAEDISVQYGLLRTVMLLQSDHPTLLVTWGLRRPKVILPRAAYQWPEDRIRVVLCHELAHIRRRDWMLLMAAELLRSFQWFNPVAWIACTRLRQESEHACDDVVLGAGIERSDYATHLLDLARAAVDNHTAWSPALAIARPSTLEGRIRAMLNVRLNRTPITRWAGAAIALVCLAITVPIAGFTTTSGPAVSAVDTSHAVRPAIKVVRMNVMDKGNREAVMAKLDPTVGVVAGTTLAQTAFATFTGTLVDPLGGLLPGVTLSVVNLQSRAKQEVHSDRTGRFEFVGLPGGDYAMEASLPGFMTVRQNLTFSPGLVAEQNITMQIGSITETITVTESETPPSVSALSERVRSEPALRAPERSCDPPVGGGIGGNIKPPRKLNRVNPSYPSSARDARIQGVVILHAVIDVDGFMRDVQVLRTPDSNLAGAAADAVSQWRFDATRLNCVPVETGATVTVNFQLAQ